MAELPSNAYGYLTSMAMNPFSGIPGSHSANFAGGHPSQSGYHHPPLPEQRKNPYALGKQYQELMPALEALQRYGQPPSEQMSMRSLIHQDYHFATQYEPQASAVPTAPNLQKNLRSPNVNLFMAGLSESERHVVANRNVPNTAYSQANFPQKPTNQLGHGANVEALRKNAALSDLFVAPAPAMFSDLTPSPVNSGGNPIKPSQTTDVYQVYRRSQQADRVQDNRNDIAHLRNSVQQMTNSQVAELAHLHLQAKASQNIATENRFHHESSIQGMTHSLGQSRPAATSVIKSLERQRSFHNPGGIVGGSQPGGSRVMAPPPPPPPPLVHGSSEQSRYSASAQQPPHRSKEIVAETSYSIMRPPPSSHQESQQTSRHVQNSTIINNRTSVIKSPPPMPKLIHRDEMPAKSSSANYAHTSSGNMSMNSANRAQYSSIDLQSKARLMASSVLKTHRSVSSNISRGNHMRSLTSSPTKTVQHHRTSQKESPPLEPLDLSMSTARKLEESEKARQLSAPRASSLQLSQSTAYKNPDETVDEDDDDILCLDDVKVSSSQIPPSFKKPELPPTKPERPIEDKESPKNDVKLASIDEMIRNALASTDIRNLINPAKFERQFYANKNESNLKPGEISNRADLNASSEQSKLARPELVKVTRVKNQSSVPKTCGDLHHYGVPMHKKIKPRPPKPQVFKLQLPIATSNPVSASCKTSDEKFRQPFSIIKFKTDKAFTKQTEGVLLVQTDEPKDSEKEENKTEQNSHSEEKNESKQEAAKPNEKVIGDFVFIQKSEPTKIRGPDVKSSEKGAVSTSQFSAKKTAEKPGKRTTIESTAVCERNEVSSEHCENGTSKSDMEMDALNFASSDLKGKIISDDEIDQNKSSSHTKDTESVESISMETEMTFSEEILEGEVENFINQDDEFTNYVAPKQRKKSQDSATKSQSSKSAKIVETDSNAFDIQHEIDADEKQELKLSQAEVVSSGLSELKTDLKSEEHQRVNVDSVLVKKIQVAEAKKKNKHRLNFDSVKPDSLNMMKKKHKRLGQKPAGGKKESLSAQIAKAKRKLEHNLFGFPDSALSNGTPSSSKPKGAIKPPGKKQKKEAERLSVIVKEEADSNESQNTEMTSPRSSAMDRAKRKASCKRSQDDEDLKMFLTPSAIKEQSRLIEFYNRKQSLRTSFAARTSRRRGSFTASRHSSRTGERRSATPSLRHSVIDFCEKQKRRQYKCKSGESSNIDKQSGFGEKLTNNQDYQVQVKEEDGSNNTKDRISNTKRKFSENIINNSSEVKAKREPDVEPKLAKMIKVEKEDDEYAKEEGEIVDDDDEEQDRLRKKKLQMTNEEEKAVIKTIQKLIKTKRVNKKSTQQGTTQNSPESKSNACTSASNRVSNINNINSTRTESCSGNSSVESQRDSPPKASAAIESLPLSAVCPPQSTSILTSQLASNNPEFDIETDNMRIKISLEFKSQNSSTHQVATTTTSNSINSQAIMTSVSSDLQSQIAPASGSNSCFNDCDSASQNLVSAKSKKLTLKPILKNSSDSVIEDTEKCSTDSIAADNLQFSATDGETSRIRSSSPTSDNQPCLSRSLSNDDQTDDELPSRLVIDFDGSNENLSGSTHGASLAASSIDIKQEKGEGVLNNQAADCDVKSEPIEEEEPLPPEMWDMKLNKKMGETWMHKAAVENSDVVFDYALRVYSRRSLSTLSETDIQQQQQYNVKGCCMSAADVNGDTPLLLAVKKGSEHIARRLLESGVEVNQPNMYTGSTALHWAVEMANVSLTQLLLSHGACLNQRNYNGVSVMQMTHSLMSHRILRLIQAFLFDKFRGRRLMELNSVASNYNPFIMSEMELDNLDKHDEDEFTCDLIEFSENLPETTNLADDVLNCTDVPIKVIEIV
ncbi:uncharacterized protein LOC142344833 isoform X2 [Convolutriloba macropyga]|uniref:uncharacterized protein LOC142344833 isoform X2 n=2 Tax=Convolutriloba macropyga TaxID=536237 RepID=UPI003F5272E1